VADMVGTEVSGFLNCALYHKTKLPNDFYPGWRWFSRAVLPNRLISINLWKNVINRNIRPIDSLGVFWYGLKNLNEKIFGQ
jgi:hypothetical protein